MNIRDSRALRILLIAFAMLAHPAISLAQQTAISGIVTDESKAVLLARRDRDQHRVPAASSPTSPPTRRVPAGRSARRAATTCASSWKASRRRWSRTSNCWWARTRRSRSRMKLATFNESVTVSGAAPLVDVAAGPRRRQRRRAPDGGDSDRRAQLAAAGDAGQGHHDQHDHQPAGREPRRGLSAEPGRPEHHERRQQSGFGEPIISRDAIAEYQIITNLFDVTMGRSTGIQVQAVTKSGANISTGSFYGFFRDRA